jgi:transcriptional regulator with XRE-family HTH domain
VPKSPDLQHQPQPARLPSEVFASQLAEVRARRGWSQQILADHLGEHGVPIDRSIIGKIEAGRRGVSLDELFIFAAVLGVSPLALCLPRGADDRLVLLGDEEKWVVESGGWELLGWWRGLFPLGGDDVRFFFDQASDIEAKVQHDDPHVAHLLQTAMRAVRCAAEGREDDLVSTLEAVRDDARAALRRIPRR